MKPLPQKKNPQTKIESLLAEIRQETFRSGYREGRIEARISIVRRMRRMGMEWSLIEQVTGLNWKDYRDLRKYWPGQIS